MKQDALAQAMGISQQAVSLMENSEVVDDEKLAEVAKALGVTAEGIKNFSEDVVFQIIGNTYNDQASSVNYGCTFNPLDKLIEVYEENKRLYERLLEAERRNNNK